MSAIYCSWSAGQEQTQGKVGTWTGKIKATSEKKGEDQLKMKCSLSLRVLPTVRAHGAFNKPEQDSGNGPDGISEVSNYYSLIQINKKYSPIY